MYPSLILIIVNKERSMVDTFGLSTVLGTRSNLDGANGAEYRPATIGHLVFTATKNTVDSERSLSPRHSVVPVGPGSSDSCVA